jgi:hypothetical protein
LSPYSSSRVDSILEGPSTRRKAEKVWKDYSKKKKEYDAYRIMIVVSVSAPSPA